jgi:polysaccharide transporter, PST family
MRRSVWSPTDWRAARVDCTMLDRSTRINATWLVALQVCNYLLPFLLIPILIRRLGLAPFGAWALVMALVSVVRTIVAYGFDMSGARDIAMRPNDNVFAGGLLAAITAVRLVFLAVAGACLVVAAQWMSVDLVTMPLILLCVATLIGDALAPSWLYYGKGEIALANGLRIVSRAVLLVLALIYVNGP